MKTPRILRPLLAGASDLLMCGMMNLLQERNRRGISHPDDWSAYVRRHLGRSRGEYFSVDAEPEIRVSGGTMEWESPGIADHPENAQARVELLPCGAGWDAPTVLMLHALMSTNGAGYRKRAKAFHARGWNAVFAHLPYHYSRTPKGFFNGELAVTSDLVRTTEGLRQAVVELRQTMNWLRAKGCREFGLWATSYGAWIGALLASVECDFRFIVLMTPIVDVEHAVWHSAASRSMRRQLQARGITGDLLAPQLALSSPHRGAPVDPAERVLFVVGEHDRIACPEGVLALHRQWAGSRHVTAPQGHFGYAAAECAFAELSRSQTPLTGWH